MMVTQIMLSQLLHGLHSYTLMPKVIKLILWKVYFEVPSCSRYSDTCFPPNYSVNNIQQAFKFLFTSPTSAQDISCEDDINDQATQTTRPLKRARNNKAPTRGHVAQLLGMKSVTPRAIAYVSVQVSSVITV